MKTFTSFDGVQIAYHDEGKGPAVILLHGGFVDGLGQFGEFDRILPLLEKRQGMFREIFGGALPLPNPPAEGRQGLIRALLAAGMRTIVPDMRGFGASGKPSQQRKVHGDSAGIGNRRVCGILCFACGSCTSLVWRRRGSQRRRTDQ